MGTKPHGHVGGKKVVEKMTTTWDRPRASGGSVYLCSCVFSEQQGFELAVYSPEREEAQELGFQCWRTGFGCNTAVDRWSKRQGKQGENGEM